MKAWLNYVWKKILETMYSTFLPWVVYLLYMLYFKVSCVYCCIVLCVLLSSYLYLLYCVCTAVLTVVVGLLAISIRKVLRPATSTQVFLGFPVTIGKF